MTSLFVLRRRLCPVFSGVRILPRQASRHVSTLKKSNKPVEDSQYSEPASKLPETPCRTRFAPSPTGYLHLGSLRTALYNYLLSKATNGQFLLRLEDTDQSRLVADAEQRLYDDLKWAGLTWGEGPDVGGPYGPYRQSERLSLYDKHSDRLLEEGKAYRCFCPTDAVHKIEDKDHNSPPPPNPCLHLSAEESAERAAKGERHCVIFKALPEPTEIQDLVYGSFKRKHPEHDFILRKTDGFPTYHFANVVDDHAMKITHVIRGAEWLVSTPKHVELYKALQWEPPAFAHVGLLVDPQRQKLSKRDRAANLSSYKEDRIIPAALLNFAALLGWSPGAAESEVLTLEAMVQKFQLRFTKGDVMVKLPGKLPHFDFEHKRRLLDDIHSDTAMREEFIFKDFEEGMYRYLTEQVSAYKSATGDDGEPQLTARAAAAYSLETRKIADPAFFLDLLKLSPNASQKEVKPLASVSNYRRHMIWQIPEPYLVRALRRRRLKDCVLGTKSAKRDTSPHPDAGRACAIIAEVLDRASEWLERSPVKSWTADRLVLPIDEQSEIRAVLAAQLKGPDVPPEKAAKMIEVAASEIMRWALMGSDPAPPNKQVMEFLGKEECLSRIRTAAKVARKAAEEPDWQPEGFEWVEVRSA